MIEQNEKQKRSENESNQQISEDIEEDESQEEDGEYDLMEYGDELNDSEERRYAEETYGKINSSKNKEQKIKEQKEIVPLAKEFSRRANRGMLMGALLSKAQQEDENEDDFWGGLGAEFFGIKKKKGGKKGENEQDDNDDVLRGLFENDDNDDSFNSEEASQSQVQDSFDSDFGREEEDEEAEQEQNQNVNHEKNEKNQDEDRIIALQEKKEAKKHKVKFQQTLNQKSKKSKFINKREQKQIQKQQQQYDDQLKNDDNTNIRKSNRILKIEKKNKPDQDERKVEEEIDQEKGEKQQNIQKNQNRAPVGSLTNNPEWNGVINEIERASLCGALSDDQYYQWQKLLRKATLTPLEKMQEAAFTELINTRSLEQQKIEEDERVKAMLEKRDQFKPDEKVFKYRQSINNQNFLSEYIFPSISHYPKSFNTFDTRQKSLLNNDAQRTNQKQDQTIKQNMQNMFQTEESNKFIEPIKYVCSVTGENAIYKDPFTRTPYANKQAFKIIREKFFHRDEDKLYIRLQVLNDLINQKRKKLKMLLNKQSNQGSKQLQNDQVGNQDQLLDN